MLATGGVKSVLPPSSGKPTVSPDAPSLYLDGFAFGLQTPLLKGGGVRGNLGSPERDILLRETP